MEFRIQDPEQMHRLGLAIARVLRAGDLLLLNGPLGAGKTTLTRGIGEGLGASGTVQSPTFVLARTHRTEAGPKLVHVDAYRLNSAVELDDLDINFANSIVVVEWARDYIDGLAEHWLQVDINRDSDDESRMVTISGIGQRWQGVEIAISD
ncbi:MAG: tRNA ((37)-N6)-threonylcarbamoyltransferase complex ATPase subunit type 1 TsaE [Actinomycetota bacterium]